MALPILLDCDPGHDDAIAIVLALASPELDVKAITSSAGNQTPEKTLRNVLRMLTWICPYISRHLLSLNPLQARCRRYSRGER